MELTCSAGFGLISVLRPFNTFYVILGAVSYPNHSVPGQASLAVYQYLVHILSPVTDKLLFLNQRKRENGRKNLFMTKSPRKNVPDIGIKLGGRLHAKRTCFRSSYRARFALLVMVALFSSNKAFHKARS